MTTAPNLPCCTWKPTVAGILSIIAGGLNIIAGAIVASFGSFGIWHMYGVGFPRLEGLAALLIVLGVISIIGGIFALRRRAWGMALAGAICALFPPPVIVLGILSIIFVALAKGEFDQTGQAPGMTSGPTT